MNQDQALSLLRGLLKWAGAALIAHHATKVGTLLNVNIENIIGLAASALGFILSHQWHGATSNTPTPTKPPGPVALLLILALPALLLQGCNIFGGNNLQAGGAYAPANFVVAGGVTNVVALSAPDQAFYAVDASFDLAASTIDAAFKFERDNRALLWKLSPNIKHQLDAIRPEAWNAIGLYTKARAGYMAFPTPDGLTTMQMLLSKAVALASAAQAAIAPAQTPAPAK